MGFFGSLWSGIKHGISKAADVVGSVSGGIGKAASWVGDNIGKVKDIPIIGTIASPIISTVQGASNMVGSIANTVNQGARLASNVIGSGNYDALKNNMGQVQQYISDNGLGKYVNSAASAVSKVNNLISNAIPGAGKQN